MSGSGNSRLFWAAAIVLPLAASVAVATCDVARADDGQTPAGAGAAQQAPANKPGFLHQLEVWWNDSFGDFNAKMKSADRKSVV